MLVRDSGNQYRTKKIKGQWDAASVVREFLAGEDREVVLAICLDRSGGINSINIVAVGCLSATITHPREVFKSAILSNADRILIAHNHPSGNLTPSVDDINITWRLIEAGKILGIEVVDHIIVTENGHASIVFDGRLSSSKPENLKIGIR